MHWTLEELHAIPADTYRVLVEWLNESSESN
jgi:hypothetical protein